MSVYLEGGKVLLDNDKVATSENCCCEQPCPPNVRPTHVDYSVTPSGRLWTLGADCDPLDSGVFFTGTAETGGYDVGGWFLTGTPCCENDETGIPLCLEFTPSTISDCCCDNYTDPCNEGCTTAPILLEIYLKKCGSQWSVEAVLIATDHIFCNSPLVTISYFAASGAVAISEGQTNVTINIDSWSPGGTPSATFQIDLTLTW